MKRRVLTILTTIAASLLLAFPVYAQSADQESQQGVPGNMAQGQIAGSDLMGASVQGKQGNNMGEVNDLVLSQEGNIEYIVVAEGGIMGFGSKMAPIPWQQVQQVSIHGDQKTLTVDIDEQKFQNAPRFSSSEWQQMSTGEFDQQVRGYYGDSGSKGQEPYKPEIRKEESGAMGQGQQQ